jgi:glycosyltransferase involved in cell wall biosynthesis
MLARTAKQLGIADATVFWGVRSDVSRLLAGIDIFLMPSRWEGLPIALIEAQASGLFCITSSAVTAESDICQMYITHIDLAADTDKWISAILDAPKNRNPDAINEILEAGYSVSATAQELRSLYLGD